MTPAGLPHSETHGSLDACSSPWLFAACRVLLRLPAPRHPPCALTALDQFASLTRSQRNGEWPSHPPFPMSSQLENRSTVRLFDTPMMLVEPLDDPNHPNCQRTAAARGRATRRSRNENRAAGQPRTAGIRGRGFDPSL